MRLGYNEEPNGQRLPFLHAEGAAPATLQCWRLGCTSVVICREPVDGTTRACLDAARPIQIVEKIYCRPTLLSLAAWPPFAERTVERMRKLLAGWEDILLV